MSCSENTVVEVNHSFQIKFHPWTLETARVDSTLADAVQKAIDDIVNIVTIDGIWRREKEAPIKEVRGEGEGYGKSE